MNIEALSAYVLRAFVRLHAPPVPTPHMHNAAMFVIEVVNYMDAKLWEKHVEWEFARRYVSSAKAVLPIDTDREYADALMAPDNHWLLLELKREYSDRTTERLKYPTLNWKRATSVLNSAYGKDKSLEVEVEKLKKALHSVSDHEKVTELVLQWEDRVISHSTERKSDAVFHRAHRAVTKLLSTHQYLKNDEVVPAPHLFVYSADKYLTRLYSCHYWGGWVERKDLGVPGEVEQHELAVSLASAKGHLNFAQYVKDLGDARGYPDSGDASTRKDNLNDVERFLGRALCYGRLADGREVILPLLQLITLIPKLKIEEKPKSGVKSTI